MAIVDPFKIQRPTPSTAAPSAPGAGARPIVDPFVPKLLRPQPKAPTASPTSWTDLPKDAAGSAVGAVGATLRGFGEGARTLARPIVSGVNALAGSEVLPEPVNPLATPAGAVERLGQRIQDSTSDAYRQQVEATTPTGTLTDPGTWGFKGDPTALGAAGQVVRGLGSVAPVVASALLTRGASLPAALGTSTATAAAQGGGFAAGSEEQRIRDMPQAELDQVPEYRNLIAAGATPAAARDQLAIRTGQSAFSTTAPVSALSGLIIGGPLTRPIQSRLATAIGGGALRRAGVEGVGEGLAEGAQEVVENAAQVYGANRATGEQRDPMEDSLANFALGAATGGVMGAGTGALSRPHIPRPQPRAEVAPEGVQRPTAQPQTASATPAGPARPRYPDAAPGSLADAANAVPRPQAAGTPAPASPAVAAAPAPAAQQQVEAPAAATEPSAAPAGPQAPELVITPAPWINQETGELTPPNEEQITQAMVVQLQAQAAAGQGKTFNTAVLGRAWGLNDKTIRTAKTRALRLMADQNAGATQAEARAAERDQQQMELEEIIRGPREPEQTNAIPARTASEAVSAPDGEAAPAAADVPVSGVPGAPSAPVAGDAAVDGEALTDGADRVSAAPAAVARERVVGAGEAAPADAARAAIIGGGSEQTAVAAGAAPSDGTSARSGSKPDLRGVVGATSLPSTSPPAQETTNATESESGALPSGAGARSPASVVPDAGGVQVERDLAQLPAEGPAIDATTPVLPASSAAAGVTQEQMPAAGPSAAAVPPAPVQPAPAADATGDVAAARQRIYRGSRIEPADVTAVLGDQPLTRKAALDAMREIRGDQTMGAEYLDGVPSTKRGRLQVYAPMDVARAARLEPERAAPKPPKPVAGERIDTAAHASAVSPTNDTPAPTQAQKEAGNYAKGHVRVHGLDVSIENPAGTRRRPEWKPLEHHYGYIRRTEGADGDQVDVFLGPRSEDPAAPVFVVDQVNRDGSFDEHKILLGFDDEAAARKGYLANYEKGWTGLGSIRQMSVDEFKGWLREGDTTKPAADGAFDAGPERAPRAARGMSSDAHTLSVAKAVQEVVKGWGPNQPRVRVLRSAEELPAQAKRNPRYARARGWYDGKSSVYVVAPNVATVEQGLQTLIHEAIGHYGIDSIIDQHVKDGWKGLVGDIVRLRDSGAGSEATRSAIESTRRRYPGVDDVTFAKEFIAIMAERGVRNGLMGRVVAALRAWLRRFAPNLRYTDAEMRQLLAKSEEFLSAGESAAERRAAVQAMAFSQQAPTFYSALAAAVRTAKGAPRQASAKAWKEWLDGAQRRGEFKGDERAWLGVDAWLDSQGGNVSRQQVEEFISANEVAVTERVLGEAFEARLPGGDWHTFSTEAEAQQALDEATEWINDEAATVRIDENRVAVVDQHGTALFEATAEDGQWRDQEGREFDDRDDVVERAEAVAEVEREVWRADLSGPRSGKGREAAKFGEYTLPGGEAYRELLLTLPRRRDSRAYESSHFPGVPNIVAHVRFNERTDPEGHRVLFVEEIQSDWHQEGRRKGYRDQKEAVLESMIARRDALPAGSERDALQREINAFASQDPGVPDAPFKTTWPMLAFKRALRWAAENGFDKVAWTTGEQQAARYDLSKRVSEVEYLDGERLVVRDTAGAVIYNKPTPSDRVADVIGKDPAERLLAERPRRKDGFDVQRISGSGLKVGGEGMQAFYDRMLPGEVGKYVKRWGAKVGTLDLPRAGEMNLEGDSIIPVTDRVHAIDVTPAMRQSVMEGQGLFSMPAESADALIDVMAKPDESLWQAAKGWAAGRWQDLKPTLLGGLQLRHLLELAEPLLPGVKQYAETAQRMATDRNQLLENVGELAQEWRDWAGEKGLAGLRGRQKPEAKTLSTLIHDVTIDGVDPSEAYQPLTFLSSRGEPVEFSRSGVAERIKEIRGQMRGRPGDDKTQMLEQIKFLKGLDARERARKAAYPRLVARWQQLSPEAQAIYRKARDHYRQHSENVEAALIARVDALDVPETKKRALTENIRLQFETQRLEGVYFPLQRFGDYWISATSPSGERAFVMFETYREYDRAAKQLAAGGYKIEATGRKDSNYKAKDAPSGTFVAEIVDQLKKAGAPETVQDQVYQTYLKALPEMSMRKHSIHRKAIAGYSGDAMRAFAKNGFHGAHQLAKLRFSHILTAQVDALQAALDNRRKGGMAPADAAAADALLGELRKRHDWILSPKDSQLSNMASAIGFIYYLGVTPAAAIVNLTQGAQVTFPALAAKHGAGKAGRMLWAATRDAMRTWGNIERTLTTDDDKAAYRVLRERGDIEKTQAHSLAGIAEGDTLRTNPTYAKVMNGVSYLFQRMEIINREAAGIASFRLARSEGMGFDQAVQYASDILAGTHFDYCVDTETEILTVQGWKRFDQLSVGDTAVAVDSCGRAVESAIRSVNVFPGRRNVIEFSSSRRFSMVVTPHHECVIQRHDSKRGWGGVDKVLASELAASHHILRAPLEQIARESAEGYSPDFCALLGWVAAEGWYTPFRNCKKRTCVWVSQSFRHNPDYVVEIRELLSRLGGEAQEYSPSENGTISWTLRGDLRKRVLEAMPDKLLTFDMLQSMDGTGMAALLDSFCKGDGARRGESAWTIAQAPHNGQNLSVLQAAATLMGRTSTLKDGVLLLCGTGRVAGRRSIVKSLRRSERAVDTVWCPTTEHGTWVARRNGAVFVTGNSNANRARFMQGNVAKVLLQFRSYSLGMSWMLGRNLYQSFKGESPEVRRLARRTLTGILGMTALFSGAMGLPFIGVAGMVASALHAAFGDDDEPYDFQVEFRSWLAEHLGADAARWIADGAVNRLGADVAGRVGMADLWFREPDRELEGRDLYYHLLEQAAGPMGGIAKNVLVGKQQVADGHVWRGIETMLPKFAKDAMKSVRFATEGANTLRGDPIIEDVTNPERFIQVLGFTPTRLKEQYAVNRALKNYESHILDRRQQLLNAFALGTRLQDEELRRAALERIAAFNRTYPEIKLDAMSIRRSLQTRARYSAQADAGIVLNKRIADRVREQVAPAGP